MNRYLLLAAVTVMMIFTTTAAFANAATPNASGTSTMTIDSRCGDGPGLGGGY